jgi:hypothetical protein
MFQPSSLLRRALLADALASGAMGVLLVPGAGALAPVLGLPAGLLLAVGLLMLPWAACVFWLARQAQPHRRLAWAVVWLNALWVADSLLLLASSWVQPTALGVGFVLAQALAVALLATAQALGLNAGRAVQAAE